MAFTITFAGIDEALSHFDSRNKNALKYRLVTIIREHYENTSNPETISPIDTDDLVRIMWDIGNDSIAVKNRRKNLISIRSSINNELEKLYEKGKNPEGIIIGPGNTFVMSDEARNKVLDAFVQDSKEGPRDEALGQIKETLKALNGMLSGLNGINGKHETGGIKEIQSLIQALNEKVGFSGTALSRSHSEIFDAKAFLNSDGSGSADEGFFEGDVSDAEGPSGDLLSGASLDDFEEVEVEEVGSDEIEEVLNSDGSGSADEGFFEGDVSDAEGPSGDLPSGASLDDFEEMEVEEVVSDEIEAFLNSDGSGSADEGFFEGDVSDAEGPSGDLLSGASLDDFEEVEVEEVVSDEIEEVLEEVDDFHIEDEKEQSDTGLLDVNDYKTMGGDDEKKNSQMLAEKFNEALAAMDKFYNQYIRIPEGTYTIGGGTSSLIENIGRMVRLPSFYISKFPITNSLFEIFVHETGYKTTAEKVGYGTVFHGRHFWQDSGAKGGGSKFSSGDSALRIRVVKGAFWYQPLGPGSTLYGKRHHPVVQVSLEDASAFAAWTGKRLPSEEEWEAASRTSSGFSFPWGSEWLEDACNFDGSRIGDTTPVDRYSSFENVYGLCDSLGNVLEWTNTHSKKPNKGEGLYVTKGGSFISGKGLKLSDLTVLESRYHSNLLGFRCVAY